MTSSRRSEDLVNATNAYLISYSYTNERYENLANSWQTWLIVNLNTEVGHFLAVLFIWLMLINTSVFDTPSLALNFVGCFYLLLYIYARQLDYINYCNKGKQQSQVDKAKVDTVFACLVVILMTGLIIFMSQLTTHVNKNGFLVLEEIIEMLFIITFVSQGMIFSHSKHIYTNKNILHDRAKIFRHMTGKNTWFKINTILLFLVFIISFIIGCTYFALTNNYSAEQIANADAKTVLICNLYEISLFIIGILIYQELRLMILENIQIKTEINNLTIKGNSKIEPINIFKVVMAMTTGIIMLLMFYFLTQSVNFTMLQNISWENIRNTLLAFGLPIVSDLLVIMFVYLMLPLNFKDKLFDMSRFRKEIK